jgi:hypothetical protein
MITIADRIYFSDLNNPSKEKKETEEVCIANISPLERQKRLMFGIRQFIFTLIILGTLVLLHVNPLWRLPLLLLFWAAATGYFQARDKT